MSCTLHVSNTALRRSPDSCNRPAKQSSFSRQPIVHASRRIIPERDPEAGREEGLPERAGQALHER